MCKYNFVYCDYRKGSPEHEKKFYTHGELLEIFLKTLFLRAHSTFTMNTQNSIVSDGRGSKKPAYLRLDSTGQDNKPGVMRKLKGFSQRMYSENIHRVNKLISDKLYNSATQSLQPQSFKDQSSSSILQFFGLKQNNLCSEPPKNIMDEKLFNHSKHRGSPCIPNTSDCVHNNCDFMFKMDSYTKRQYSVNCHPKIGSLKKGGFERFSIGKNQPSFSTNMQFMKNFPFPSDNSNSRRNTSMLSGMCAKKWPNSRLFIHQHKLDLPQDNSSCTDDIANTNTHTCPSRDQPVEISNKHFSGKNNTSSATDEVSCTFDTFHVDVNKSEFYCESEKEKLLFKQTVSDSQTQTKTTSENTHSVDGVEMDDFCTDNSCQVDIKCLASLKENTSWDNLYDDVGNINTEVLDTIDPEKEVEKVTGNLDCSCKDFNCLDLPPKNVRTDQHDAKSSKPNSNKANKHTTDKNKILNDNINVLYIRSQKKCKPKRKRKTKGWNNLTHTESKQKIDNEELKCSTSPSFEIHFIEQVHDLKHWIVTSKSFCDEVEDFLSDSDSCDTDTWSDNSDECDFINSSFEDLFSGNHNTFDFNLTVSIKSASSCPEDTSVSEAVKKANMRWKKNCAVDTKTQSECFPKSLSKVHFAPDSSLSKTYPIITWAYAYQNARKGPWEEYARDRQRFSRRIKETERVLTPILEQTHRQQLFNRIHKQ